MVKQSVSRFLGLRACLLGLMTLVLTLSVGAQQTSFFDLKARDWSGNPVDLSQYEGKVVLVVNTATNCGYAPQLAGLQKIYEEYKDQGFVVLSFPANDFAGQEPFSNFRIRELAEEKYQITFPQMDKISVKGSHIHPVYQFLTSPSQPQGIRGEITWNFNKFLVGRDGRVVDRFTSAEDPKGEKIKKALLQALAL